MVSSSYIQLKIQDFWVISDLPAGLDMTRCGLGFHQLKEKLDTFLQYYVEKEEDNYSKNSHLEKQ